MPKAGTHDQDPHAGRAEPDTNVFVQGRFSTEALPPHQRFPFWKETICDVFANIDIKLLSDLPFRGEVAWRSVDVGGGEQAMWTDIDLVPVRATHDTWHIAREPRHMIGVCVHEHGRGHWTHAGRSTAVGADDMFLVDTTRRGVVEYYEPYRERAFKVPYHWLAARLPRAPLLLGRTVSARSPLGGVLVAELAALGAAIAGMPPPLRARLIERAVDLVALTFTESLSDFAGCGSTVRRAHLVAALQFIEANLGDPDLSVARVAAAVRLSAGYLHELFKGAEMAVAEHIRRRRLERCRDDLADPRYTSLQIAEIALRWGFRDMPNFSRAFRRQFGLSPREHRALAAERDRGMAR